MKVVIGEDDAAINELLKMMVTEAGHLVVGSAYNGPEVVALTCQLQPDALLLDVVMPDPVTGHEDRMAGINAAKEILSRHPLPIILITAYDSSALLEQASQIGVGALLVKPPRRGDIDRALTIASARFKDLMELRRMNAILKESESRFRSYFEQPLIGIAITSIDKGWIEVNDCLCNMLGYTRPDILRFTWAELTHPDDLAADVREFNRVLAGEIDGYSMDKRFIRKDGEVVWVSLGLRCVRKPDGNVDYFLAVLLDITRRKALEAQLRQAQKLESVGQLAGGVAHDFNNILAAIMMHLNLLEGIPNLDEETRQSLKELMEEAKRAADLTRQLLMFSRRSVLDVKTLDLNDVAANLIKMLGRLIGENIKLRFERDFGLPMVEADPGMIEQVLLNLSVNARDAMPQGGTLTISLDTVQVDEARVQAHTEARLGRFVCLSVADTGCGMDGATLQRIFEPFFTTKEIGKGTGLGLATVHGIVGQHQGWVEVESQLGQGTTFRVFLPVSTRKRNEPTQKETMEAIRGSETILLVEDELSVRRVTAQSLRVLGYGVFEARNGPEALKLWNEHHQQIHLLLTDMVMPEGMTGLELAAQLRQTKPGLKVIVTSGYSADIVFRGIPAKERIVRLQKPYQKETLSQVVRQSLDRS